MVETRGWFADIAKSDLQRLLLQVSYDSRSATNRTLGYLQSNLLSLSHLTQTHRSEITLSPQGYDIHSSLHATGNVVYNIN